MATSPTPVTGVADCALSPSPDGCLICHSCGQRFAAADVDVRGLRRVEGGSDPEYQALEVRLVPPCPEGRGREQRLRLGYGPTASRGDALMVEQLPSP